MGHIVDICRNTPISHNEITVKLDNSIDSYKKRKDLNNSVALYKIEPIEEKLLDNLPSTKG